MKPDDDLPEVTDAMLARAELRIGERVLRRGRPPSAASKLSIKLRLDPDVIEHFRATGPGWQTRINATLRRAAKSASTTATFEALARAVAASTQIVVAPVPPGVPPPLPPAG